jgi:nitroimidazol reductase NimA-like FMN-containing flavoprotein (pyridoxamine 5'-phosphate oxidase superfamily)
MDEAAFDVNTDELDSDTCWRLLARAWVGRVGFVDGEGPAVLPVNSAVHGHAIVFRTGGHTALHGLEPGATVAFEVDHTDRVAEAGWSVLVRGQLWEVTDPDEQDALWELPLHPWVEGDRDVWMKITPATVTGRITSRHRVTSFGPRATYMPAD